MERNKEEKGLNCKLFGVVLFSASCQMTFFVSKVAQIQADSGRFRQCCPHCSRRGVARDQEQGSSSRREDRNGDPQELGRPKREAKKKASMEAKYNEMKE